MGPSAVRQQWQRTGPISLRKMVSSTAVATEPPSTSAWLDDMSCREGAPSQGAATRVRQCLQLFLMRPTPGHAAPANESDPDSSGRPPTRGDHRAVRAAPLLLALVLLFEAVVAPLAF